MACTTEKTSPFPVELQSNPSVTEKYYVEVKRCGTAGSYTFVPNVRRESDDEAIAMINSFGIIVLTNLNDNEKPNGNKIKSAIKQALNKAKQFAIGQGLTTNERERYIRVLGFTNVDEDQQEEIDKIIQENIDAKKGGGVGVADTGYQWKVSDFLKSSLSTNTDIDTGTRNARGTGNSTKPYGNYYYPEDLASNRQDRVRFTQKYTEGTKLNLDLSGTKVFQRKVETIDGSVTLPIVTGIQDQNGVDWKDDNLNPIQGLAAAGAVSLFNNVSQKGLKTAFAEAGNSLEGLREKLLDKQIGGEITAAINVYLAQSAVGAQGLLSRTTGSILNPNLEMLFGGPQLRRFAFSFKLSPRDADEATQVRKIIRFFKQGMSVKTSSNNVFLKTPNVFDIQYQTYNSDGTLIDHPSINFIKTCALTSCVVQYTPDGSYMTYEDPFRTMTAYTLILSFGELDPIYDSDYTDLDNDDDQVIGY